MARRSRFISSDGSEAIEAPSAGEKSRGFCERGHRSQRTDRPPAKQWARVFDRRHPAYLALMPLPLLRLRS